MTISKRRSRVILTSGLVLMVLAPGLRAADFYVSTEGHDDNPGTLSRPFATVQRAQQAVRAKIKADLKQDIEVAIRAGTYTLTEPLVFAPADSVGGEHTVTYTAHLNEHVVISGGRRIEGWRKTADGTWQTTVPQVEAGDWTFRQLFVNGKRAIRARSPNSGYVRVDKVGADQRTHFQFKQGDIPPIKDVQQTELVFLHDWSITRVPIKSIDHDARILTVQHQIGGPSHWAAMDWFEKQPRYYLENAVEFLDAPGEWFLDKQTGVLSYRPLPGEGMSKVDVIAPVAEQLLVVRGEPGRYVEGLQFVGLTFAHAGWAPEGGVYWGRQACTYWSPATQQRGRSHNPAAPAAVHFELAQACTLQDCTVTHIGPSAVWVGHACRNCLVRGCAVTDVGGNGIMIGEGQWRQVEGKPWWEAAPQQAADDNQVRNNLVEHCGKELYGAVGVWVGLAGGTTISRNEIRLLPYTGVSLGWMWWDPKARPEPRKTPCHENVVANNHIHHVMQILSDGGGIYTLGLQPDSFLRGNVIHHVPLNVGRAESNGMFLDQGTGAFVIEDNVIFNVDRSPLRFHKGWENLVRNNVLQVGEDVPVVRYNDTKEERIKMEDNTIVKTGPAGSKTIKVAVKKALSRAGLEPAYRKKLLRRAGTNR